MAAKPTAIIDIGSNSVRLVVYSGAQRVPFPIFNEKVLAGLGSGLAKTGAITPAARDKALQALKRFKLLVDHMGAATTHVVATAAARDASNGRELVADIRRLGLRCRVLSAEQEATLAGLGVISGIPDADGIAGDLGGGSLELVDVANGVASAPMSMPLGVLRVDAKGKRAREVLRQAVRGAGLTGSAKGRTLYLVGGSWRSLARIDMIATDYPLPIIHQYPMAPERAAELRRIVEPKDQRWTADIAPARLASSPAAAMLLAALVEELRPAQIMVSAFGIREGLLYSDLRARLRSLDPLTAAARELSTADRRVETLGDSLDSWIDGGFDDPPALRQIRLAACLLAHLAWQANPEFRADRAVEQALHANWVGIDARGRVMMAQALSTAFGRDKLPDPRLAGLCRPRDLLRAKQWGLAIRTAQRLSGGIKSVLHETRLLVRDGSLQLEVPHEEGDLVNDGVLRRLSRLAASMELKPQVRPN
ncbi:MAG: Ppx/GppA family phosphatase [Pseudomonadota bacterium]|nr:Ppx/GppA family phosphatase [Sphingomonas sp.]MDQ3478583.1 Ppx/GppA family phosphatase [Pseudomonadota bacterium]